MLIERIGECVEGFIHSSHMILCAAAAAKKLHEFLAKNAVLKKAVQIGTKDTPII